MDIGSKAVDTYFIPGCLILFVFFPSFFLVKFRYIFILDYFFFLICLVGKKNTFKFTSF